MCRLFALHAGDRDVAGETIVDGPPRHPMVLSSQAEKTQSYA